MSTTLLIAMFVLFVLGLLIVGAILYFSTRKLGSTPPDANKPDWLRAAAEEVAAPAPLPDGSPERIASPVAEAIEALLQDVLASYPELSGYKIDLGSAPDGGLEIWVNGEKFDGIDALKDEKLKQVFREVIEAFNK